MEIKDLLSIRVSYQEHFWSEIKETSLSIVLKEIQSEKHGQYTNFLREFYFSGDKENYGLHKRKLPVVTFCGTYELERTKEHLNKYNYLVVLDIDKLGSTELERVKDVLLKDQYVFSFWESPSKDGLKGLVHLKYKFDIYEFGIDPSHKIAFNQLRNYFFEKYNVDLDKSGSDITRLCFISQDKELVLKDQIESFSVEKKSDGDSQKRKYNTDPIHNVTHKNFKDLLYNPRGKNNQFYRKTIKDITSFLRKNSLSITHSYEEWLRVAFAISNTFTYDIGLQYFLNLCLFDKDKFNVAECKSLLMNCYENTRGEIKFRTIIYLAIEKGFIYKDLNTKST